MIIPTHSFQILKVLNSINKHLSQPLNREQTSFLENLSSRKQRLATVSAATGPSANSIPIARLFNAMSGSGASNLPEPARLGLAESDSSANEFKVNFAVLETELQIITAALNQVDAQILSMNNLEGLRGLQDVITVGNKKISFREIYDCFWNSAAGQHVYNHPMIRRDPPNQRMLGKVTALNESLIARLEVTKALLERRATELVQQSN